MTIHTKNFSSVSRANTLLHGDCLRVLRTMKDDSIDLICTDPPYGISFMKNEWDTFNPANDNNKPHGFQQFIHEVSKQCLRVLKPGAFMLVTMTPRQDCLSRVLIAMEDAGFNMGFTSIYWTYASGFPKAHNIGKHVDRQKGRKRKIIGHSRGVVVADHKGLGGIARGGVGITQKAASIPITSAASPEAKLLDGSYGGFQPKPAVEVVVVAMKPLAEKSYVAQALKNRKGITWLDDVRVPTNGEAMEIGGRGKHGKGEGFGFKPQGVPVPGAARFPANLVVSDAVLGDYSRFFSLDATAQKQFPFLVVPKAGKREKGGLNDHPTVKPLQLMAYLVTLGSRPGDVVLDPFLGSGTTAVAAKLLGRRYVGIEREKAYFKIAQARVGGTKLSR